MALLRSTDIDSPSGCLTMFSLWRVRPSLGRAAEGIGCRQDNREAAAAAVRRHACRIAAVVTGDLADQREAEPAASAALGEPCRPVERLEILSRSPSAIPGP